MPVGSIKNTFGKRAPDGAWEVSILGDIGFFGVDGAELIRELKSVNPSVVRFIIYSPGGAVYDAIAVAGWILDKGIECYAEIYGVCASAATVFAALAGPKNTAIAPGSMFLVHMPYGGDQKAIDNATDFLVDLYAKSYGWTKAEARKYMEAEEGQGIFWTASEAKKLGILSEIMEGAKVAAHYQIAPVEQKEKTIAMSDKKKLKVTATVHLTTMEAARAAFSDKGTLAEVEIDMEQATADAMAGKDTEIAQKDAEIEALKKKVTELEAAKPEDQTPKVEALSKEVEGVKAEVTAKDKEIEELKAQLKAPVTTKTVANNTAAQIAASPNTGKDEKSEFVGQVFAQMTDVQKAQHAAKVKAKKITSN